MAAMVQTFTASSESTGVNSLTCISCRLSFRTSKEQRLHYQTEIHRFNLKRKVAELPPVTQELYEQKIAEDALKESSQAKATPNKSDVIVCVPCHKKFASPATLQNHIKSKKHLDKITEDARKAANPDEIIPPKKKTEKKIPIYLTKEDCIRRDSMEIETKEGKELTEEEVEDKFLEDRIKSSRKILAEECLFCLKKCADLESNAKHMSLKHSFFIPDIEYLSDMEGFFKYIGEKISVGLTCIWCNTLFATLEAILHHMMDTAHCKLNYDNVAEFEDFYDFSKDYEGEDEVSKKKKPIKLSENGYELILSDGRALGHRSLSRYYNQNFRVETRESMLVARVLNQYRMLGYNEDWEKKQSRATQPSIKDLKMKKRLEHSVGLRSNIQMHYKDPNKVGF